MTDLSNLRTSLPNYESEELDAAWEVAYELLVNMNELEQPCAMSIGTRRIIFQVLLAMKATDVLEIGTFTGLSALAIALAMQYNRGRLVSVDIEDVNAQNGFWARTQRPHPPNHRLRLAGLAHRVDFVAMDSVAFLKNTTRRFDFICLDGWHDEEAVYAEINLSVERLKPDGLIFLDDVQVTGPPPGIDKIEGPLKAVRRCLAEQAELSCTFVNKTLEGDPIAVAFLTRDSS